MGRRRSGFKIPGTRKPSLNRMLGISNAKRKMKLGNYTNPEAAFKRQVKRATGYYSPGMTAYRKSTKGCRSVALFMLVVGVVIAIGIFSLPVNAQPVPCTPNATYVTGGLTPPGYLVNFRAWADTDAPVLAQLTVNTPALVLGSMEGDAINGSTIWCQVIVAGATGYIHATFLSPAAVPMSTPTPPPAATSTPGVSTLPQSSTYYVGASGAALRLCPERGCQLIAELPTGSTVTVVGTTMGETVMGENPLWYQIQYNSQTVYVYSALISSTPLPTPTNTQPPFQFPVPTRDPNATPRPTPRPQTQSGSTFVCPSNCAEARARGVSASRAASCGLDRDHDGVACYGD